MIKKLCKQHFIDTILLLGESPRSFNELLRILNAYPDTLNRRLKELCEMGIIVQIEKDNRTKYRLTEKGYEIARALEELLEILKEIERIMESGD